MLIENIDIWKLHPSKRPLRSNLSKIEELMASIMEKGLLQPLIVRPCENWFEVVAGNRRLEACKRLGLRKLPCIILELDDKEAFEVSLTENIQHRTLDPIDEAKAFKEYVDEYGWGSISALAKRIGKSVQYVSARLKLLELPPKLQEEISRRREIPVSVAQELLPLDEDLREEFASLLLKRKVSRRVLRNIIKSVKKGFLSSNEDFLSYYAESTNYDRADKIFVEAIGLFKAQLIRFDEIINQVEDEKEWLVRETLMLFRSSLHQQIDTLLKVRKKLRYLPQM